MGCTPNRLQYHLTCCHATSVSVEKDLRGMYRPSVTHYIPAPLEHPCAFQRHRAKQARRPPSQNLVFVCLFIAHLQSLGLKYSTIRNYTPAIVFVHKISGHVDPTTDQRVSKVLQGVRSLQTKASKSLLPITKPILQSLVDAIPFCSTVAYNRTMLKAIFLMCSMLACGSVK